MKANHSNSPIHRYFAGLAENTFHSELGVVDPPLIDYLSDMLVRFVRSDVVHRIRSITGRPLMTVTEMTVEASARLGDARRELYQHIGDFTLFWAGVYPEALRSEDPTDGQFSNYMTQGKRSYRLAAEIQTADEEAPESDVLGRLSLQFELCAYGLREVRRVWEEHDNDEFGPGSILLN